MGIYVQERIGAIVVGMPWSMQDLKSIRELSHAEIAFFDTSGVLLSSGPPFPQLGDKDSAIAWSHLVALSSDWPSLLPAGPERFMVVKIGTPDDVSPAYMVARSLDQQLAFWNRMWSWLLELGIGGVLIGCAVSFILALGISRPIHILQSAFRRVAQGDFEQPALVRSRDEFAELATSFNRMQEDLIERAHMKHALLMAEEVQRSLLPVASLRTKHLDIAGASIYCNAIAGNQIVYSSNAAGNFDIWIVEFEMLIFDPPAGLEFGSVNIGSSQMQIVTLSYLGGDIEVSGLSLDPLGSPGFSVGLAALQTVAIGDSLDIPVTFAPTVAGAAVNSLIIDTDACRQLADAANRTDGTPQPPDFVEGSAAAELIVRIELLRTTLGCSG